MNEYQSSQATRYLPFCPFSKPRKNALTYFHPNPPYPLPVSRLPSPPKRPYFLVPAVTVIPIIVSRIPVVLKVEPARILAVVILKTVVPVARRAVSEHWPITPIR